MTDDIDGICGGNEKASDPLRLTTDQGWGILTHITLPGGGKVGVYAPNHARPPAGT